MKINPQIYPSKPSKKGLVRFNLVLRYTNSSEEDGAPVFDILASFRKNALKYKGRHKEMSAADMEHLVVIAGQVHSEFRAEMIAQGLWDRLFNRAKKKHVKKEIGLNLKLHKDQIRYKKAILEIKGNTPECIKVRDRIFAIKDYVKSLNYSTQSENVKAILAFLNRGGESRPLAKLVYLRDFIQQYINLNAKRFSANTLRAYKRLHGTVGLYCQALKINDEVNLMTKDQQNIFFSGFVDFLLEEHRDGDKVIKKAYENGSVKDAFKLLSAINMEFEDLVITVRLSDFVQDLRTGKLNMPFCVYDDVIELYRYTKNHNFGPNELQDEKSGDLFVFQFFTGLRYGELVQVEDSNIHNTMYDGNAFKSFHYVSDKTGEPNSVPLNHICLEIIEKWRIRGFQAPMRKNQKTKQMEHFNKCLLPWLAQQQVNTSLHSILAKIPRFHVEEKRIRFKGSEKVEQVFKRYDLITTHTARHSYSHYLMSRGMDVTSVSKLLNHSSSNTTDKHYKHFTQDELQYKAWQHLDQKIG